MLTNIISHRKSRLSVEINTITDDHSSQRIPSEMLLAFLLLADRRDSATGAKISTRDANKADVVRHMSIRRFDTCSYRYLSVSVIRIALIEEYISLGTMKRSRDSRSL